MLEQFVDEVKDLQDVGSFETVIGRQLESLGFERFAYLALRLPNSSKAPFVATTYPESWALHYHHHNYVNHDPVLTRAARSMRAFDWPGLAQQANITPGQKQVLNEARDFGIGLGCTVPIHSPGGGFATLSVASSESEQAFSKLWQRKWQDLHLIAIYSHAALEAKLLDPHRLPEFFLTDRERECLLWTARGKTAPDIGVILGISQETVVFHLKNVMQKVGVYSKHHAVVKAIMMGLIHP